ncbi:MAG: hypothetical protein HXY41_15395 [Chloroflexi bacterium]|nr:hypothetical protein [Chloroflexota bacterium]
MNTSIAITLATQAAELTDLTTRFQARYSRLSRLSPDTPVDAHRLAHAIFEKQRDIALVLDVEALIEPQPRWPWWKHQLTLDLAAVSDLAREINHLITCCAYSEAVGSSDLSPAIRSSQAAIAGMLHPDARAAALQRQYQRRAAGSLLSWN